MSDLIGQHLGPYRIIEQIGVGGMATVYKAFQPAMDRYVAVKVIAAHFAQDPTFTQRFRREARAIAQLEHAHILPVYDYGEAGGLPYLVMRYLEAGTLEERLVQGLPSLLEVNRIIGQVGSALDYAHRVGIVHRDVKPSNVLVDAEGNTYLTDFGLAKMVGMTSHLTGPGVGIGTPTYMSPEQGQGAKVDARTDVYSLGVMLYRIVTGRVPYDAETPLAIVLKHVHEPLPLPRSIRPDLPEGIERVILRAMAKEPEDRFQTVKEMVYALDAAVRAAEAAARTEPKAKTAPMAVGARAAPQVGVRRPRWLRWVWWAAGGVGALAALLLLGLAFGWWGYQVGVQEGQLVVIRPAPGTPVVTPVAGTDVPVAPLPTATLTPRPAVALIPGSSAEQARAFGDPILATIVGRPPDFEDDFSSDDSGWAVHPSCGQIVDGRLRMSGHYGCGAEHRGALNTADFVFQAKLTVVTAHSSAATGIQWRHTQQGYYRVAVDEYGHWDLSRCSSSTSGGDDLEVIREWWGPAYSALITVIGEGDQFAVYIDEEPVFYLQDDLNPSGQIDLWLHSVGGPVVVEFDKVKMWDITDLLVPTAGATPTPMPTAILTPGPAAEQARAFGDPILAAIADRPPDYEDDFSDPSSGWDWSSEPGGQGGYISGEHFLITAPRKGAASSSTNCGIPSLTDMVLEVDIRFVTEQVNGVWGIRVHEQYSSGANINVGGWSDGRVVLGWEPGGAYQFHDLATQIVSSASSDAEKHLQIIVRGSEIAVYVDDRPLVYYDASSIEGFPSSGTVSFVAIAQEDETFEIRLDDLRIWDITDLALP
jgi:hypothetical protein